MTQLSICTGILVAQGISIPLSTPKTGHWRYIPLVSGGFALIQIVLTLFMVESPFWLAERRKNSKVFDTPSEDELSRDVEAEDEGMFLSLCFIR